MLATVGIAIFILTWGGLLGLDFLMLVDAFRRTRTEESSERKPRLRLWVVGLGAAVFLPMLLLIIPVPYLVTVRRPAQMAVN